MREKGIERASGEIDATGESIRVPGDLFRSFFLAGFECSTHRVASGRRLDVVSATKHDRFAILDYLRLTKQGIASAREGLRWHLIEPSPGRYDFSTAKVILDAAKRTGVQIVWDLFHYGWPDDIDIFSPDFIDRFSRFVDAFALFHRQETDETLFVTPVNEISFIAWGGGDKACLNPFCRGRGHELKRQLVRATITACETVWSRDPKARIVHVDPVINILPNPLIPNARHRSRAYNEAQFQSWDMIAGHLDHDLGGSPRYLDIIGVNYYPKNQWMDHGRMIPFHHPRYKPFRQILCEVSDRYNRPFFISETGTEDEERGPWFRYVAQEASAAIGAGALLNGLCLYPIVNHPGWEDDRHCHNGLWDYADEHGQREIYAPLETELHRAQHEIAEALLKRNARQSEELRERDRALGMIAG